MKHGHATPRTVALTWLAATCTLGLAGCDRDPNAPKLRPTSARTVAADPTATGVIRGRVTLTGPAPVMQTFDNEHCHAGHSELVKDESVVVGRSNGLRDCVVYVEGIDGMSATASPVMDQIDCRYVPHVVAISSGQSVVFKSSDDTFHNVHIQSTASPENHGLPRPGAFEHRFDSAEFVKVRCDVHPWMTAWVAVVDSPCYAVTTDDGSFELRNVPSGTRRVALWHARYGRQEKAVDVPAKAPVEASFTVSP